MTACFGSYNYAANCCASCAAECTSAPISRLLDTARRAVSIFLVIVQADLLTARS